jgi:hypothetical protein
MNPIERFGYLIEICAYSCMLLLALTILVKTKKPGRYDFFKKNRRFPKF